VCDKCVEVCPNRANYTYMVSPVILTLPTISCQQGKLVVSGEEILSIEQARQIIHVDDFCNECGNCATFCVHDGKPYLDKPRLFLQESDFRRESDNAFHVGKSDQGWVIRRREGGTESWLTVEDRTGRMDFANEWLSISLSPDFQIEDLELKEEFEGAFSLSRPAEMAVILKGLLHSLPFLPIGS
jgi:putative selenate reductase